jgi:hypothetical protein
MVVGVVVVVVVVMIIIIVNYSFNNKRNPIARLFIFKF